MNWPFVRRSKYENLIFKNHIKNKRIEAQRNEVISLQQELSSELRSHKETKEALKIAQEDLRQHQMSLSAADLRADQAKSGDI